MKNQEVVEIVKTCRVDSENSIVFLPEIQLDRKTYLEVAKHLEALGGKWNKKSKGFVFTKLPDELLPEKLPEHPTSIKKTFQFFPTPRKIADDLIDYAMMWKCGNSNHPKVLEPSAGHGVLIESLRESYPALPFLSVHYCELMKENLEVLAEKKLGHLVGDDFLNYSTENKYDIVIANPPFTKNQDIIHITKMIEHLNSFGIVATISSNHWRFSNDKKSVAFRELLESDLIRTYRVYDIDPGAFKESGTNVGSTLLVVQKN